MRKIGCLLLVLVGITAHAQREIESDSEWTLKDRLYFGGGFGINSGRDFQGFRYTSVSVNPIVGYMVTPEFSAGTGISYSFLKYPEPDLRIDQYGISPFARYNIGQLFFYGEYNLINTQVFLNSNERRNFDRLFLGLGYTQPIGRRGAINAMALYDVLYDQTERVFASPWDFRVFFSF
jgi:hypothetical protein